MVEEGSNDYSLSGWAADGGKAIMSGLLRMRQRIRRDTALFQSKYKIRTALVRFQSHPVKEYVEPSKAMTKSTLDTLKARAEALTKAEPKTCDGCKWWSGPDAFSAVAGCNNSKLKMDSEDGLYPTDYHADDPWVETGPKFGCVHWEKK